MTATTASAASDFRVGAVFGRSFEVLRRQLLKFCLLALAMLLPLQFIALNRHVQGQHLTHDQALMILVAIPVALLLFGLSYQAIIYAAFQTMRGREFGLGEAFGKGLRRLLPLVGAMILMVIAIVIGFVALVVPGVYMWTMFFVAVPACVVERLGPFACLGRSADLTKGNRWRVLGVAVVLAIMGTLRFPLQHVMDAVSGNLVGSVGDTIVKDLLLAFQIVVYTVTYHDLRIAQEGVDIENLASVFD